jgi:membrane-bound lytic murein transglycosylase A
VPASPFAALPGWSTDHTAEALPAWRRTCERLLRVPDGAPVGRDGLAGTAGDWQPACRAMPPLDADDDTARAYFERWFVPTRVTGGGDEPGLFTGYYEPELHGSRTRHGRYTVPLYPRPADLVTTDAGGPSHPRRVGRLVRGHLRAYYSRAQIAAGVLARRTRALVWVDDRVDAFFLEIQGSGRIVFEDGTAMHLNYAGANGQPYVALGRVLIARGALERSQVSLQTIRAWLLAHPREAQAVMNQNPSYVFFRVSDVDGALGSEGVVLTPGRSLAVDTHFVPLGAPLFLDIAPLEGVGAIQRLVVAQDTGGAIRGVVRGDVFWGAGPEAYDRAGRMRQAGRYWILAPRSVTFAGGAASADAQAPATRVPYVANQTSRPGS